MLPTSSMIPLNISDASINSFSGRIAASRARSLLVYLSDMPRHSLRGSLRFIPQKRISRGSSLLIFISQGSHTGCCDLPVLERAHAADPQATYDHTINLQRHTAFGRDHAGEDEMYQSAALHRIFRCLGGTLKSHCRMGFLDRNFHTAKLGVCLLYTSDAADDLLCVDLGGRPFIKK